MPTRVIKTEVDLARLFTALKLVKLPLTVRYEQGVKRSLSQNRLQRLWCNEVAEQMGDRTPEEVRGHAKLTMGVPILRAEHDDFCAKYDKVIRPLSYEDKLDLMMEPINLPVTSLMLVGQKVRYLDHMLRFYTERGIELTQPDAQFYDDLKRATPEGETR